MLAGGGEGVEMPSCAVPERGVIMRVRAPAAVMPGPTAEVGVVFCRS